MSTSAQNSFDSVNDGSRAGISNADFGPGDCKPSTDDYDFTTASGEKLNLVPTCSSSVLLSDTINNNDIPSKGVQKSEAGNDSRGSRRETSIIVANSTPLSFEPARIPVRERHFQQPERHYPRNIPLPSRDQVIVDRDVRYPPYRGHDRDYDSNRTVVIIGDSGNSGWGNTGFPNIGIPDIYGGNGWPGSPGWGNTRFPTNIGIPDIFGGNRWPGTPGINPNSNYGWNWQNRPVWGRGNGPTYQWPGNGGTYSPIDHGSGTQDPGDWENNNGGNGQTDQGWDPLPNDTYTPTDHGSGTQDPGDWGDNNGGQNGQSDIPVNDTDVPVDGNDQTEPGWDPLPNDTYTPTDHGSGTQDPGDWGDNNGGQNGQSDIPENGTDIPVDADGDGQSDIPVNDTDVPVDGNDQTDPGWDPLPNDTYTPTDHGSGTQNPGDWGNNNGGNGQTDQGDQIPWNPPIDYPNQGSSDEWIPPVTNPTYPDQGTNVPWNPPIPGSNWPTNDDYYPLPDDTYTPTNPGWDPLPNDTYTPTDHGSGTQEPGDFGNNNGGQNGQSDIPVNDTDVPVDGSDQTEPGWDPLPNDTYTPTDHGSGTQEPGDFGNNNGGQNGQSNIPVNDTDVPVDGSDQTEPGWDPLPNDTYTPTDHGSGTQDPGDFGSLPTDLAPVQPFIDNGAGLNFDTPTEFAANGNVPDFILNSNGQLTPNPAKEVICDDGVIDIQVSDTGTPILANPSPDVVSETAEIDDAQSRAEKDANEAQKAKIQDLIRHFQKNNPGKPIPQEWTDILNSEPETPQSNGNNDSNPGYDLMPNDTYTPTDHGSGYQDSGDWGNGNGTQPNQTPIDSNQSYYPGNNQGGGSSQGQPNLPFLGNRDYDDFRRNNGILPPGSNGSTLPREYINNPTGEESPIEGDWRYPTNDSPIQNTPFDRQPDDSPIQNTPYDRQQGDHVALERDSSIEGEPTITPERINEVLESYGSPAAGLGQHIYDEGVRTGINPALALAVFAQETGAGTEGHSPNSFNIGDITSGGNPKSYQSFEQGITDWYNTMDSAGTVSNMIEYQTSGTDANNNVYLANINGLMESWDAPSQCETGSR